MLIPWWRSYLHVRQTYGRRFHCGMSAVRLPYAAGASHMLCSQKLTRILRLCHFTSASARALLLIVWSQRVQRSPSEAPAKPQRDFHIGIHNHCTISSHTAALCREGRGHPILDFRSCRGISRALWVLLIESPFFEHCTRTPSEASRGITGDSKTHSQTRTKIARFTGGPTKEQHNRTPPFSQC